MAGFVLERAISKAKKQYFLMALISLCGIIAVQMNSSVQLGLKTSVRQRFPSSPNRSFMRKAAELSSFPSENLPVSSSKRDSTNLQDPDALLIELLDSAGISVKDMNSCKKLSAGFCNYVWHVPTGPDTSVVAKVYSPLHSLRTESYTWGLVDKVASDNMLGPKVVHESDIGIIHEFVSGRVLEDNDMFVNCSTFRPLALKLSRLHSLEIPLKFSRPETPLIWEFLERMLNEIKRKEITEKPLRPIPQFLSSSNLEKEIRECKQILEPKDFSVVLAHGDCKPANAMKTSISVPHKSGGWLANLDPRRGRDKPKQADDVLLIDFELSGPNYRGYDIMKLFRKLERGIRDDALRDFLSIYTEEAGIDDSQRNSYVSQLQRECEMIEPLTWLEAVTFFALVLYIKPNQWDDWISLAESRWQQYLTSKAQMEQIASSSFSE